MKILLSLLVAVSAALPAVAQEAPDPSDMMIYYVGFLYRGDNWTPEVSEQTREIQAGHMAHINRMAADGKLVLAGPFMDDGDLRGMFVFTVDSMEEAEALVQQDPAVQAGRLRVELHPWYSMKGITVVPPVPEDDDVYDP